MLSEITQTERQKFQAVLDFFQTELKNLRTGRAQTQLVENLEIDSYGSKMILKNLANLVAQDARTIVIQPWDSTLLPAIKKAIDQSRLGLTPILEEKKIRLSFPLMTEERRQELVKILNTKTEEAKISLRIIRENILKTLKLAKTEKSLGEDESLRQEKGLQKLMTDFNDQIQKLQQRKEQEIMAI